MVTLTGLYLYPVKSMRALKHSCAQVLPEGLAFDRQFMVTETDGTFITARQTPRLVLFTPAITPQGLELQGPDGSTISVPIDTFTVQAAPTEVWGNHFSAHIASEEVNRWLSGFFQRPVQLRWLGPQTTRRVKDYPHTPLTFADGFPLMLASESSLRDVQNRCPAAISMTHFRPNLVIAGAPAWAEDEWKVIRIGKVVFDVARPCSRCIFTTISPTRGEKHPSGEPLRTLQAFRSAANGDVDFGLNLIPRSAGMIQTGDDIEVITTTARRVYGASTEGKPITTAPVSGRTLTIDWQGQTFNGNNQHVLLEQLEQQGIRIPYSCRAGLCGSCRVKLVAGEVTPLRQGAMDAQQGTILCCSCVPKTAVRLAKV